MFLWPTFPGPKVENKEQRKTLSKKDAKFCIGRPMQYPIPASFNGGTYKNSGQWAHVYQGTQKPAVRGGIHSFLSEIFLAAFDLDLHRKRDATHFACVRCEMDLKSNLDGVDVGDALWDRQVQLTRDLSVDVHFTIQTRVYHSERQACVRLQRTRSAKIVSITLGSGKSGTILKTFSSRGNQEKKSRNFHLADQWAPCRKAQRQ